MKQLQCDKCQLSATCPKYGSSPYRTTGGKTLKCELIGNFGIDPVDVNILSESSLLRMQKDGPCTSYVDVPVEDPHSKMVTFEPTIIFHKPILHERQRSDKMDIMNIPYRRSYKI